MINAGTHGAVTWIDLSTPDVKAASAFYQELLGWSEVAVSATPLGEYHIAMVDDRQACGMMGQGPDLAGAPPMWTVFIYADDVDATAGRVAAAGGSVLTQPFDIPQARIAVIADPGGAMFGLFGGPEIDGEFYSEDVGRVCWAELMTRDPEAVGGFYGDLFGWRALTELAGGNPYTTFKVGHEMAAGMMMMPAEIPLEVRSYWSMYFTVADCAGTESRAVELGGEVYVPTMTLEMGRFASLADPQGATFNIMEYSA